MDGQVVDVKTGVDEAAPVGSTQQIEWKQPTAPGTRFEMG
jgi:hypothetical protein